jgi:hypothetical protein
MGVFYHPGGDSLTIALTKFVICLFVYKPGTPMKKILKKISLPPFGWCLSLLDRAYHPPLCA